MYLMFIASVSAEFEVKIVDGAPGAVEKAK